MFKLKKTYLITTALINILFVSSLFSQTNNLDELVESEPVEDITNTNKMNAFSSNRKSKVWLKPGTNFSKIFLMRDPTVLYDWLGHLEFPFKVKNKFCGNEKEYAFMNRNYLTNDNKVISLNLLVPHPKYEDLVNFGYLDVINKHEPPALKVKYSENFYIKGLEGELHYHDDSINTCSIIIKFIKESRIIVSSNCSEIKNMKKVANTLSYERLKEKLNS